jgi:octaheme c-type cytochrome (tetrathionate reductase family)
MRSFKSIWLIGLGVTLIIITLPIIFFAPTRTEATPNPWDQVPKRNPPTSHQNLIKGTFSSGPEVTALCLTCHADAAHEVSLTSHWTWRSDPQVEQGQTEAVSVGKANLLNNFCIGIQSNWTGCTRCHAGYGWGDAHFDFSAIENVDCLACHDQTGTYAKAAQGEVAEGVDLLAVAQSVGTPTRQNCGSCHFNGGGGNAVKHGDMDESLYFPSEDIDVHMGRHDFLCIDCHRTENHQIRGMAMSVNIDTTANQVSCTDCHTRDFHLDDRLNDHLDAVACQTCHVPAGALREPTKMEWDWSTAGQDIQEDPHVYLKIKGSFVYAGNFVPAYAWYDGTVQRYLLGDPLDPSGITVLNQPNGGIGDPNALIWPFKVHDAKQIYDVVFNYLIQPQTVGQGGYWTTFDWNSAAQNGMDSVGLPYSGQYDFAQTQMYWNLSHMVVPAEYALQCTDCHGESGRLDWLALGYPGDPLVWGGRDGEGD